MKISVTLTDGSTFEAGLDAPQNDPAPVTPPPGVLIKIGDPRIPAVVMADERPEDRTTKINQTNEIQRFHPVLFEDGAWRVYPSGPIIVRVDRHLSWWQILLSLVLRLLGVGGVFGIDAAPWWQMIVDGVGIRNAENFSSHGDGFMDSNDNAVPLVTDEYSDPYWPNPEKELKLMVAATAGQLVLIIDAIHQGAWWEVVDLMDYNTPPTKTGDVWYYKGEPVSWATHPHWFTSRVNRVFTKTITWLTRNGIASANDGGVIGGAGGQQWPAMVPDRAAIERYKTARYPTLPFDCTIHAQSYVVDGNLAARGGGLKTTIDQLLFHGSATYGRSVNGNWYLLEDMIVTADPDLREPGHTRDWRCWCSLDGQYPYMPWRAYRVVRCGWQRTHDGWKPVDG
jgi:hypothetical protein